MDGKNGHYWVVEKNGFNQMQKSLCRIEWYIRGLLFTFCLNWSGGNVIIPISPSGIIAAPWGIRKS
jgi:hypothetical protein